jgi:hypothetical protein
MNKNLLAFFVWSSTLVGGYLVWVYKIVKDNK